MDIVVPQRSLVYRLHVVEVMRSKFNYQRRKLTSCSNSLSSGPTPKSSDVVSLCTLLDREGERRPVLRARPLPFPFGLLESRRRVDENGERPLRLVLRLCLRVYVRDGEDVLADDEYVDRDPERPTKPVIAPMIPPPTPALLEEYDHPETADLLGLLDLDPVRVSLRRSLRRGDGSR